MSKKILFVSNTIWSVYNFRMGLMRALKEKGFEVIVVAPNEDPEFYGLVEKEGFRIIELKNLGRKSMNPLKDLALLLELFRIYKREKSDLAIHYTIKPNIYGNLAARLAKVKSAGVITGVGYLFNKKSLATSVAKILYRIALKHSKKVVLKNEDNLNLFLREELIERDKVAFIKSSGIDAEKFSPDYCLSAEALAQADRCGIKKKTGKIVFLQSARILWDKGVGEFVEAAKVVRKQYKTAEFWLLGPVDSGNPAAVSSDNLKNWESEGVIKYLGATSEVRPYICASDVAVLASYHEGTPKSSLEAMAMEKPLITTDTPGCKDTIVDGENGFMVPVKNYFALAEAMIKMIEMGEDERKRMGKKGREKVLKEFDDGIVLAKYLEVIESALGS